MSRVEVITGPERRRRWPEAERLRILQAALAPGAVVADVARQYDVCTSLIYKWRREARGERPSAFMPVTLRRSPRPASRAVRSRRFWSSLPVTCE